jgi:hypothetical protein
LSVAQFMKDEKPWTLWPARSSAALVLAPKVMPEVGLQGRHASEKAVRCLSAEPQRLDERFQVVEVLPVPDFKKSAI